MAHQMMPHKPSRPRITDTLVTPIIASMYVSVQNPLHICKGWFRSTCIPHESCGICLYFPNNSCLVFCRTCIQIYHQHDIPSEWVGERRGEEERVQHTPTYVKSGLEYNVSNKAQLIAPLGLPEIVASALV